MRHLRASFLWFLVAALTPLPAVGADDEYVAAFEADAKVKARIDALASSFLKPDGEPHRITVSGACGVAGCSYTALVIQVMRSEGVNPRTGSVAATVRKGLDQKFTVQVVRFTPDE